MKKEWFATGELLGMEGLPKSRQGLNKRARDDGWEKRRRKGVQGRGVEYSFYSLPENVQHSLSLQEQAPAYSARQSDLLPVWVQIFQQISEKEREALITHILRCGVTSVLEQLGISVTNDVVPEDHPHS